MKKIKVILWDIDGTLLDFLIAEKTAINKCFETHGLGVCSPDMLERYSVINRKYWEKLEKGELTKPEVLVGRFQEFFAKEGLPVEMAESFNDEYQNRLGDTCVFCDKGDELVRTLKAQGYKQYAVTNGTQTAQRRKLKNSGLDKILDGVFISDEIGIEKPMIGFFDKVWEQIGVCKKDEVMIVGDSLTSDMQGGNNVGITCCWYNPKGVANTKRITTDYEIRNLQEILKILS